MVNMYLQQGLHGSHVHTAAADLTSQGLDNVDVLCLVPVLGWYFQVKHLLKSCFDAETC